MAPYIFSNELRFHVVRQLPLAALEKDRAIRVNLTNAAEQKAIRGFDIVLAPRSLFTSVRCAGGWRAVERQDIGVRRRTVSGFGRSVRSGKQLRGPTTWRPAKGAYVCRCPPRCHSAASDRERTKRPHQLLGSPSSSTRASTLAIRSLAARRRISGVSASVMRDLDEATPEPAIALIGL
jgi:hypothetical protein